MNTTRSNKIALMVVGLNGCTANTFVSSLHVSPISRLGSIVDGDDFRQVVFPQAKDFVVRGWDPNPKDALSTAQSYKILPPNVLNRLPKELSNLIPSPAVVGASDTSEAVASNHIHRVGDATEALAAIEADINTWREEIHFQHGIVIYLGPPLKAPPNLELLLKCEDVNALLESLSSSLTSGMLYAIAAARSGCAFIDFTPNATLDLPSVVKLFTDSNLPVAGRDGNTGQSLLKTVLGHMFRIRNLKVDGWYSTNILGNNDGLVLSRPDHAALKLSDKRGILAPVLGYDDLEHVVTIDYYRPRGDNKESWDNIDFRGWWDGDMSMKINWIGRDSLLAGPILFDLVRHLVYSLDAGWSGIQDHLGIYFKRPLKRGPESFFWQYLRLLNAYSINYSQHL